MTTDAPSDGPVDPRPKDVDPLAALRKPTSGAASLGAAGKYAGLGFQFVFAILLFLWVGQWVDRKLGTDGIFLILGVFLGAGAAFYSMYRNLMDFACFAHSRSKRRHHQRPPPQRQPLGNKLLSMVDVHIVHILRLP